MKHISHLSVHIVPWMLRDGMREMRVETEVNGRQYTTVTPFDVNDFESCFDRLIETAKREIKRMVDAHK